MREERPDGVAFSGAVGERRGYEGCAACQPSIVVSFLLKEVKLRTATRDSPVSILIHVPLLGGPLSKDTSDLQLAWQNTSWPKLSVLEDFHKD
jgi:hypothetical protein